MTDDPSSPAPAASPGAVGASVDLGSNSVHLLVATVRDHRLEPLVDESVFLGLGKAVDASGHLGRAARTGLVDALVHYTEIARGLGARRITFIGTEPIRRAADGSTIVHEIERATGVPLHVLTHEEEAYLTVVGVTAGRLVEHETRYVTGDPPTRPEVEAMVAEALVVLADALDAHPAEIVAVGGTASNLLKVVPDARIDLVLTRTRITEAMDILEHETADEAVERHLVKPVRARILPAGAAIMDALMTRYGVSRIRVSEGGIREGAILVVDHVGGAWRDRLPDLAHGWRD